MELTANGRMRRDELIRSHVRVMVEVVGEARRAAISRLCLGEDVLPRVGEVVLEEMLDERIQGVGYTARGVLDDAVHVAAAAAVGRGVHRRRDREHVWVRAPLTGESEASRFLLLLLLLALVLLLLLLSEGSGCEVFVALAATQARDRSSANGRRVRSGDAGHVG